MTVKGWTWYQGENDMFEVKGNSNAKVGYSCMMKALVQQWRTLWSATPNTTAPGACKCHYITHCCHRISISLVCFVEHYDIRTTSGSYSYLFHSNRQVPNSICGLPLKIQQVELF
jgi:hypothetical protein